jgi:peptidoglycan/LPS O-acetylase OafA/YrhL
VPPACRVRHFFWLDLIRGLASLSVLVWHYQHFYYFEPGHNPFESDGYPATASRSIQPFYASLSLLYQYGNHAVQLFWVISGFVFANVYIYSKATSREFFVHRFARLYPLHFLTLLIVAALQLVSVARTGDFQIYPDNDAYHFVLNLLFVSHWGFERGDSFNAPIWSVSVEIFIYLVFWFSLPYLFRRGIVGPLVAAAFFYGLLAMRVPGAFWECGMYFFLGCATYVWLVTLQRRNAWNVVLGAAGTVLAAVLLLTRHGPLLTVAALLLFPAIVLLATSIDVADTAERGRPVAKFGDLTYAMYLLHIPIQICLILLIDSMGIDRLRLAGSGLFLIFFIALVITVSAVSYRYYELPARHAIRSWFSAKSARGPAPDRRSPQPSTEA